MQSTEIVFCPVAGTQEGNNICKLDLGKEWRKGN